MRPITTSLALLLALLSAACRPRSVLDITPTSRHFQSTIAAVLPAVTFIEVQTPAGAVPESIPLPPGVPVPPPGTPTFQAGSGVVFAPNGYILTAAHVVQGVSVARVTLYDRRQFSGRIVGLDPSTDVAVIKIEAENLPAAVLGESDAVQIGEWVLALGSPLGLLFTATSGIVGGKGRSIGLLTAPAESLGVPALEYYIQTDAPVNPGNSGGPLVDLQGRVIGINTAIASVSGLFAGVGFAVPIDLVRRVAMDLIRYGVVRRPVLGVMAQDVTAVDMEAFHLPAPKGAKIVHIEPGSPAARAGLQLGDVIVGVDNKPVDSSSELQLQLAELEPGATVPLRIYRGGKEVTVPVQLGMIQTGSVPPAPPPPTGEHAPGLGFAVSQQNGALVVAAVRPYSAAVRAGVRPGQVLLKVNGQDVHTIDDLTAALQKTKDNIVVMIVRDPQIGEMLIDYRLEAGAVPPAP
jgi:serine protease Do